MHFSPRGQSCAQTSHSTELPPSGPQPMNAQQSSPQSSLSSLVVSGSTVVVNVVGSGVVPTDVPGEVVPGNDVVALVSPTVVSRLAVVVSPASSDGVTTGPHAHTSVMKMKRA